MKIPKIKQQGGEFKEIKDQIIKEVKNSKELHSGIINCNSRLCMLGLLNQKYLEDRRFSADGFGGMHKMSIVRDKWANVYEDCKYLGLRGSLGKILDTNACVAVLA